MARRPPQLELFSTAPGVRAAPKPEPSPLGPAPVPEDIQAVAQRLNPHVRLGTSSWTFPGWKNLIFNREATQTELTKDGLAAYAAHPLFRTVGIDRTFYGPLTVEQFAEYTRHVPLGFEFLVKAHELCTLARFPTHARYGAHRGQPNGRFLDSAYARDAVVQPFVEGLGPTAGPLVFQFPPQDPKAFGGPEHFADRLFDFLTALPKGPLYAVELRNRELLTPRLNEVLDDTGALPVIAVWGQLPPPLEQARLTQAERRRAMVIRWMLPPNLGYEEAREKYAPFDRLVDEDLSTREELAILCTQMAREARNVYVTINNKAEGSAPLSALKLAERIACGTGFPSSPS